MIVNPPQSLITSGASANQIVNAGFETDVFPPWTDFAGNVFVNGQIITTNPHSGTYCANIYPSGSTIIQQVLPFPIPVAVITSFRCYYRMGALNNVYLRAIYTDATYDEVSGSDNTGNWTLLDGLSALTAGKTVAKVRFTGGTVSQNYVDDFTLQAPTPKVKPTLLLTYQPQN